MRIVSVSEDKKIEKRIAVTPDVAKMFSSKIKLLPPRRGERFASALTSMNLSNKVYKKFGKINLKDYIKTFIKSI